MELTMNDAMNQSRLGYIGNRTDLENMRWRVPSFGIQKYIELAVNSIFHTIHCSFDYRSKATVRELVVFIIYAVLLQGVLIPTETYTTFHAHVSMLVATGLTDLVACILPGIALLCRWMKSLNF